MLNLAFDLLDSKVPYKKHNRVPLGISIKDQWTLKQWKILFNHCILTIQTFKAQVNQKQRGQRYKGDLQPKEEGLCCVPCEPDNI